MTEAAADIVLEVKNLSHLVRYRPRDHQGRRRYRPDASARQARSAWSAKAAAARASPPARSSTSCRSRAASSRAAFCCTAAVPQAAGGTVDLAQLDPKGRQIRAIRGRDISMIFQEPMSSLSPVHTIGHQIVEAHPPAPADEPRRGAQARHRSAGAGEDPPPRAQHRQLSVRVQRRHAAARHDGHGAGLRAQAGDRRRADDRARRHHAGRDPRPDEGPAVALRHGADVHHP